MSSRRDLLKQSALWASAVAVGPRGLFAQAASPAAISPGKAAHGSAVFQPNWESLRDNYQPPSWMRENRLGIFIHWGLYSIPARINEWYGRHMYTSDVAWHTAHYGPPDKFGYKDFIPLFKAEKFHPDEWAQLFREAGAGYVVPVAEHCDGFAMWDSNVTRWCAGKMGPKRDLIGEIAAAVRKQNLIFGCSSHRMEHHNFMYPAAGVPNDEFDPRYAGFYGPPQPGDMNDGLATVAFQKDWLARSTELMQKYRPQLMYFDNGVNSRAYDGVKLEFAARFYNHAAGLGEDATIVSKDRAYLAGSVNTFENATRAPKWIYPGPWLSDDTIGDNSWGYVDGMKYHTAQDIVTELIELTCKGGGLLLNVSPMGDGSIPAEQQVILREVGTWMRANGAALNGSRPWLAYGEGPGVPPAPPADWRGGSTADTENYLPLRKLPTPTEADFRFTVKADSLFVIGLRPAADANTAAIRSLANSRAQVERVMHVASSRPLGFRQTADALIVDLPRGLGHLPYVLAVQGKQPLSA